MAKKAILVPYARACEWCSEIFPGLSISALPVVGKPFIEYQLDALAQDGFESVLVLDYEFDAALAHHLSGGDRQRWPFDLEYRGSAIFTDEAAVRARNASFVGEDGETLLVLIGMQFPTACGWRTIGSLADFYALNFEILACPGRCILDGYSCERDVRLGMNVVIKTGRAIDPPVFLGDSVRLEYGVSLTGGVIVGRGSVVDEGTSLERTIVFPNTYVGPRMEFRGKIVTSGRVIDPESGVYVDLEDRGMSSEIHVFHDVDWFRIYGWFLALLLTMLFTVPYLLWVPIRLVFGKGVWFHKLSFDRYPRFWRTLFFRNRLVKYHAGDQGCAFSASDGLSRHADDQQRRIDETWYRYNRTLRTTTGIVFKALINRLFLREDELGL